MLYTNLFLFGMGLLGMILQFLVRLDTLNRKTNGDIDWDRFFRMERFSIFISLIVVIASALLSHEIKQLEFAGKWLGFGMFSIGYMAQSLLVHIMKKVESYTNDKKLK